MQRNFKVCELCNNEGLVRDYYQGGRKWLLCNSCGNKISLKHQLIYKIRLRELTLKKAIIQLMQKGYNKDDILFILDITEQEYQARIKSLKNLVRGTKKKGLLYE